MAGKSSTATRPLTSTEMNPSQAKEKPPVVEGELVTTEPAKPKAKGKGRPTDYTPELGDKICGMLSGGMSLKRITDSEDMPSRQTVYTWLRLHEEFLDNYTRAKEDSADALADDIEEIAEGTLKGTYDPQAARVAMDGKKWIASKLKPKKYGDKLDITGEQTINHKLKALDDDQLDARIEAAVTTAKNRTA